MKEKLDILESQESKLPMKEKLDILESRLAESCQNTLRATLIFKGLDEGEYETEVERKRFIRHLISDRLCIDAELLRGKVLRAWRGGGEQKGPRDMLVTFQSDYIANDIKVRFNELIDMNAKT